MGGDGARNSNQPNNPCFRRKLQVDVNEVALVKSLPTTHTPGGVGSFNKEVLTFHKWAVLRKWMKERSRQHRVHTSNKNAKDQIS